MTSSIDLSADIGEGGGHDEGLLRVVTSCNIACGGHTGDEGTMRQALLLARRHKVAAGAHPSYPDPENFGRMTMAISDIGLKETISEQIFRLSIVADGLGMAVTHVKPHGALYNDAASDGALARILVQCVRQVLPGAALVGPPNSALEVASNDARLRFVSEGFADRAYEDDGRLRSRSEDGAVIEAETKRIAQAVDLATDGHLVSYSGKRIYVRVDTICLHGDTQGAADSAANIALALRDAGIAPKAMF